MPSPLGEGKRIYYVSIRMTLRIILQTVELPTDLKHHSKERTIRTKGRVPFYGQKKDHFLHTGCFCHHFLMLLWVLMDHWGDIERPGHPVRQMRRLLFIAGRG